MPRLFMIGSSHQMAIHSAYGQRTKGGEPDGLDIEFLFRTDPRLEPALRDGELSPMLKERLSDPGYDFVVSVLEANANQVLGLLNHPRRLDFVLPEDPSLPLDPKAEVVPFALMKRRLKMMVEPVVELIAAIRRATDKPMLHVESPPPVPSESHILKHLDPFFIDSMKQQVEECGIAPATTRFKIWRTHSAVFREACGSLGIKYLTVPVRMQDDDGMLVEEGWNPDATHANARYGDHVLRKLARYFREARLNRD